MDDEVSTAALDVIRRHLLPRRHTALLVAIVAAFAVRPMIGDAGIAPLLFSIALLVLLLVAPYTTEVDESAAFSDHEVTLNFWMIGQCIGAAHAVALRARDDSRFSR